VNDYDDGLYDDVEYCECCGAKLPDGRMVKIKKLDFGLRRGE